MGDPQTSFASEGEGKAGLICPSGLDVGALPGVIQSHQDVFPVPTKSTELNPTAAQVG